MTGVKANLSSDDYYSILGVKKDATEKELTKAYRKAAMKWHPDRNPDNKEAAEKNFKKIGEAYTVLKDPKTRETYDRFGKDGLQGGGAPPSGGAGGFSGGSGGGYEMSQEQAEALFRDLFGGAGGSMGGMGGGPGNVQFVFTNGGPGGASMGGNPFGGATAGGNPFGGAASSMGGGGFDLSSLLGGLSGLGGGMGQGGNPFGTSRGSGMKRGNPFSHGSGGRKRPAGCQGPIRNGTEVTLHGLKSQPQLNGRPAVICDYDPASSRYVVQISQTKTLKIKPQNLVQRCRAEIHGLSAQQYNGQKVVIDGMNASGDRYICRVGSQGKQLALKPEKLRVDSGTRVRIKGLKSESKWNNRWGVIDSFVGSSQRYRVRLLDDPAKHLDIRPANVRV